MYQRNWSLKRVPPNHDEMSSEAKVRCLLAEGTKKSKKPHSPMKKRNELADKKGCKYGDIEGGRGL